MASGLIPALQAAENESIQIGESPLPDLDFLEFLGQFETDEGQWISPGNLMAEEFEDLLDVAENLEAQDNSSPDNDDQ